MKDQRGSDEARVGHYGEFRSHKRTGGENKEETGPPSSEGEKRLSGCVSVVGFFKDRHAFFGFWGEIWRRTNLNKVAENTEWNSVCVCVCGWQLDVTEKDPDKMKK